MKKDMSHGPNCNCVSCGMGAHCACCHGHGRYMVLRWILGLIILAVVFWVGVKIGEFKGSFEYGYGMQYRNTMHYKGGYGMMGGYGSGRMPMMYNASSTAQ